MIEEEEEKILRKRCPSKNKHENKRKILHQEKKLVF